MHLLIVVTFTIGGKDRVGCNKCFLQGFGVMNQKFLNTFFASIFILCFLWLPQTLMCENKQFVVYRRICNRLFWPWNGHKDSYQRLRETNSFLGMLKQKLKLPFLV